MKVKVTFVLILFSFLFQLSTTVAQRICGGVFTGISNYQGDIVKYHLITRESNFAYGGFLRYNVSKKLSIKGNVYHGTLSGSDANFEDRINRGFSFATNILEGGFNLEFDVFSKGRYDSKGRYMPLRSPYIFTGFGAVMFKPEVTGLPDNAPEIKIDNRRVFNFMVPIGAGYKYDLDEKMTLGLEIASHVPFTDYLDGVSESGKGNNNDWYVFGGVTFAYWFTINKKKRPEFIGY